MPLKRAHTDSMPRLISVETRFVPNKATRKNTWQVNQRYSARAARNLCFSACRAKIDNEENPLETRGRSQKRGKNVVVAVDSSEVRNRVSNPPCVMVSAASVRYGFLVLRAKTREAREGKG